MTSTLGLQDFSCMQKKVKLLEEDWVKELLPLMEDASFRAVSQAEFIGSSDFKGVKDCLRKQFAPGRN